MLRLTSQMCLIVWVLLCAVRLNTISCCHESDRSLLLMFKEGVVDPSNRLSSWSSLQDCCLWKGVSCGDNNRVNSLDLSSDNHSESLRGEINLSSLLTLQFLETLNLGSNDFERMSMLSINNSVIATHHTHLLPNFSSKLSLLSLSDNINLHIDHLHYWLPRLPSLTYLDLSGIHLPSETNWVHSLASLPLEKLYLHDCNLTTSILSLQYANFSSLSYLDLGLNDFRYGLPNWLFNLSMDLSHLLLSQCNLRGQIPDLSGYQNLQFLDLSNNSLEASIPDWLGQLSSLNHLNLSNNLIYGSIPLNLENSSHLSYLDISSNNLSGAHPKILQHEYQILDLSHNSISGDISKLLLTSNLTYLSFNKFEGRLPRISSTVTALDLANNSFSGSLFSFLCPNKSDNYLLVYLDISNNFLSEELPDCWSNWADLSYIYLGSNRLSGEINPTIGSSLLKLKSLDLHDNCFYGHVPSTFKNCTSLVLLNLEGNNFSGNIPKWIQQNVSILKLRSNQFIGDIPKELCSLSNLILLDLANNRLSGSIPHCLHNITSMISGLASISFQDDRLPGIFPIKNSIFPIKNSRENGASLYTKGQKLEYVKYLYLVRSIDLSVNELFGEIPAHLFSLDKLKSLNLSSNYLRGEIPEQIGQMKYLESLDFSHNSLDGNIPQSMCSLSFLSALSLSDNNFSGQIPLGTQLQGFGAWSYIGNPELCGPPLQKKCTISEKTDNREQVEGNDDNAFLKSLYLGMGVGFAVGFWVVCGSLFLNRAWRHTYFRFFNGMVDRIYVIVAIKLRIFY